MFLAANRAALKEMSHWLLLRHAPETGAAVKFNLCTVTMENALCVPWRGCTLAWNFKFWLTCNRASEFMTEQ